MDKISILFTPGECEEDESCPFRSSYNLLAHLLFLIMYQIQKQQAGHIQDHQILKTVDFHKMFENILSCLLWSVPSPWSCLAAVWSVHSTKFIESHLLLLSDFKPLHSWRLSLKVITFPFVQAGTSGKYGLFSLPYVFVVIIFGAGTHCGLYRLFKQNSFM